MTTKDIQKTGDIFIRIGHILNDNPQFLKKLDHFLSKEANANNKMPINFEKINGIDLFQLIREKSEKEVEFILMDFSVGELREILKRYHFGSPSKLKSTSQITEYIINQLKQRQTDVFLTIEKLKKDDNENEILQTEVTQ